MYTVCKSFKIPVGHRLSKHSGRCYNFHGHNIKIDVTVSREKLNHCDMVIDFYDLKTIVNKIIDEWDHALILNKKDFELNFSIIKENKDQRKIYMENGDPTSENMCFTLFHLLRGQLKEFDKELRLKSIQIWESDESYAKYESDI